MEGQVKAGVIREREASAWWIARLAKRLRIGHRRAFAVGVLAGMAGAMALAATRPLWFDEVFTWQIATRPSVGDLIAALGPMDPSPPLHYLLVRGSHAIFGASPFATRLPALLSFLVTLVVLHRLVVPITGPLFALVAVGALLLTPAFRFAAEARPYALLLACSATSLLAWRAIASGRRRRLGIAGLSASLTAALYAHFYGFLLFVPIAAGEAVRTWTRRRFDLAVWAALTLAGVLALPLLPLVQRCLAVRATFWAAPTLARLGLSLGMFRHLALVALLAAVLGIIARCGSRGVEAAPEPPPPAAPAHEVAGAAVLACLPLIGFLIARLATNAYDGRYVLPALLGALLLLAHGSRWLRHRRAEIATVLLVAVCLFASAHVLRSIRRAFVEPPLTVPLPLPDHGPKWVVVANPFAFVQTVQAAPETMDRLVYLIDGLSRADAPRSSPDISVLGLSGILPLHVQDLEAFLAAQDRFWLFDETGGLEARLRSTDGARGGALAAEPDRLQLWTR